MLRQIPQEQAEMFELALKVPYFTYPTLFACGHKLDATAKLATSFQSADSAQPVVDLSGKRS